MSESARIALTPAFLRIESTLRPSAGVTASAANWPDRETAHGLLSVRDHEGNYLPATDDEVILAAATAIDRKMIRGAHFSSPREAQQFLTLKLGGLDHEVFSALWLDAQNRLIEYAELSHGTIDSATVYPRMVIKQALRSNAAACIFAHNHPSGIPEPSAADRALTTRLITALATIDVRVLDHIVVAGRRFESFAERGWL